MNEEIRIDMDLVFGTGGGRELKCDVYSPTTGPDRAPAVLLLHGGGWRRGSREMMEGAATYLARHGYVAVASEYRLNTEARWPALIEDVKAAIRWIRAQADQLGIDPGQLCLQGHSAGAHLALHAAATPNMEKFSGTGGNQGVDESVAAVAVFYAPVRFAMPNEKLSGASPLRALIGDDSGTPEEALEAAPIEYAHADFPPTLLLHGTLDRVVPPSSSMRMYEALSDAGAPVEIHMLSGLPHGFARRGSYLATYQAEIDFFFRRYVVERERLSGELEVAPAATAQQ